MSHISGHLLEFFSLNYILVIEDDADTRDSYVEYLQMADFAVEAVSSGAEALQLVATRQPYAILLDLTLADGDGRELCKNLSSSNRTRDIAVAVITGHSLPAEERAKFGRVFTKPVDLDQVVAWLRGVKRAPS